MQRKFQNSIVVFAHCKFTIVKTLIEFINEDDDVDIYSGSCCTTEVLNCIPVTVQMETQEL